MSSSSIYSSIVSCQAQIDNLIASINRLRSKTNDQITALSRFKEKRNHYLDEFDDRKMRGENVSNHKEIAVLAERFQAKSTVELSQGRRSSIDNAMETIQQKMQDEIKQHNETIVQQEAMLNQVKSRIAQLRTDYTNALRAEKEERQRTEMQ